MEGISVRWKATISIVDVIADLFGIFHDLRLGTPARHLQKGIAVFILIVGTVEDGVVTIRAGRTVLLLDDLIHRRVYGLNVGRRQRVEHAIDADRVPARGRQRRPPPPLLRLLHPELDAELALRYIPLKEVWSADRRVNPCAEAHALRDEH